MGKRGLKKDADPRRGGEPGPLTFAACGPQNPVFPEEMQTNGQSRPPKGRRPSRNGGMTMDPVQKDEAFIRTEDVTFSYGETVPDDVLKGITMQVKKGEFVALLGHNGSGKSTLAKMYNAMLLPVGGTIYAGGMDTKDEAVLYEIRRRVGLVLQNPDNQLVASVVEEDVAFGPENLGVPTEEIRRRVDEALKAVEMYDFREFAPHKLSGGQKQRVAIAGIIAMEPDCIVLDEPTAMLDPRGRTEVLRTIHRLNREKGITIVLITHYMDEAIDADRVIVMDDGRILTEGTPQEVFAQVEMLKKHQLDVPQSTELIYRLRGMGADLPECVLSIEDCVKALERIRPARFPEKAQEPERGGVPRAAD